MVSKIGLKIESLLGTVSHHAGLLVLADAFLEEVGLSLRQNQRNT